VHSRHPSVTRDKRHQLVSLVALGAIEAERLRALLALTGVLPVATILVNQGSRGSRREFERWKIRERIIVLKGRTEYARGNQLVVAGRCDRPGTGRYRLSHDARDQSP